MSLICESGNLPSLSSFNKSMANNLLQIRSYTDTYGQLKGNANKEGLFQRSSFTLNNMTKERQRYNTGENQIGQALALLRNELLDLKRQDTSLYTQLRSIDSHIQRLKAEIRIEEEKKLELSEDEEDNRDEIAADLEGERHIYHEDVLKKPENSRNFSKVVDTAHERYDSGIQADEGELEEMQRSRTSSNSSVKDSRQVYVFNDRGFPRENTGVDSRQTRLEDKYTTFVLTAPRKTVASSSTLNNQNGNGEDLRLRQPAVPQKPIHRQIKKVAGNYDEDRAQFDGLSSIRGRSHRSNVESKADIHLSKDIPATADRSSEQLNEPNGRYYSRKQGNEKTLSLVDISESGEIAFHSPGRGTRTSSFSRKEEIEKEVTRALDTFSRRQRPASARAADKCSSNIDLRSIPSYPRDPNLVCGGHGTTSLSDLRLDNQRNSLDRKRCGFALVPGQRNTLPPSQLIKKETNQVPLRVTSEVLHAPTSVKNDSQAFRRTYSLSAKRPVSMSNLEEDIKFYRSPSGENFQEHTVAYYNAARNFPKSVSVASLV